MVNQFSDYLGNDAFPVKVSCSESLPPEEVVDDAAPMPAPLISPGLEPRGISEWKKFEFTNYTLYLSEPMTFHNADIYARTIRTFWVEVSKQGGPYQLRRVWAPDGGLALAPLISRLTLSLFVLQYAGEDLELVFQFQTGKIPKGRQARNGKRRRGY